MKRLIEDYLNNNDLSYTIKTYHSIDDLMNEDEDIDVLFLDIELEGSNGIEEANTILNKWNQCQIVYITQYISYASDVYKSDHVYFVMKNTFSNYIDDVFEKIFYNLNERYKTITFKYMRDSYVTLYLNDIIYIDRYNRKSTIYTIDEDYPVSLKFEDLLLQLSDEFVRCHHSYIVHLPYIKKFYYDHLILQNDEKIPVSRGYKNEFKTAFLRWSNTKLP